MQGLMSFRRFSIAATSLYRKQLSIHWIGVDWLIENQLFGFPYKRAGSRAAGFSKTLPLSPMISSSPGCKSPLTISV